MKNLFILIVAAFLLSSCARPQSNIVEVPEPLDDVMMPEASNRTPGSLWSSDKGSIFSDRTAKNVGDIVTVLIAEESSASKEATTSTGRSSNISAAIPQLFGLENSTFIKDSKLEVDPTNLVNGDFNNSFDGEGTTTRSSTFTASLTTQVIGRYPNGNLKIRGGKEVMVNSEVQVIYLTGIIRPVDITSANTIPSTKILNARLSYTGKGAISDKQRPGWLMRGVDYVWPF